VSVGQIDSIRSFEAAKPTNGEKARTLEKKSGTTRREAKVVQAPAPSPLPNSSSAGVKKVKSALKTAATANDPGHVHLCPPGAEEQPDAGAGRGGGN